VTTHSSRCAARADSRVHEQMCRRIDANLQFYAGHPELIPDRIAELDRECDLETTFHAVASGLSLFGLVQGLFRRQRWFLLPAVVQGSVLQHALRGWTPPLSWLRKLGLRTREEIQGERQELLRMYEIGLPEQPAAYAVAETLIAGVAAPAPESWAGAGGDARADDTEAGGARAGSDTGANPAAGGSSRGFAVPGGEPRFGQDAT